jgi:hypothetical protein
MGSLQVQAFDEELQERQRCQDVALIDERRWRAAVRKHNITKRSGVIINGSCIIGSSGSGT